MFTSLNANRLEWDDVCQDPHGKCFLSLLHKLFHINYPVKQYYALKLTIVSIAGDNSRKLILSRGWSVANDKYASAIYDDLAIWNRPLSSSEVILLT